MTTRTLSEQRAELALIVSLTYSPDDFPGSKGWWACKRADDALSAFDAEHPEIIAEIKTAKKAADEAAVEKKGWI